MSDVFKKGMQVKFKIGSRSGTSKGNGTVTALSEKGATGVHSRMSVKDAAGRIWRPFPTQVQAI